MLTTIKQVFGYGVLDNGATIELNVETFYHNEDQYPATKLKEVVGTNKVVTLTDGKGCSEEECDWCITHPAPQANTVLLNCQQVNNWLQS